MTPQTQKIAIYSGVALALGIAVYYAFSKAESGGSATDETGNNGTGVKPVFNVTKVRDELFDAMNQFGTDETAIISALRTVSQVQFGQVIEKFGKERYDDWLGYKTSYATARDLPYWLKAELTEQEYLNLKRKYPNYL